MRTAILVCFSCALAASAAAQSAPTAVPAAVTTTPPPAPVVDGYSYQPEGRRDPFVSLLKAGSGSDARPTRRAEGAAGLAVGEISVRGVLQTRDRLVAMIQGPDNKTYIVHQGDQLSDGVVKNVTVQGLVVIQTITDPLSTQKQREVRKLLRSLEEAKE